jgi:hypothetical protein
MISSFIMIFFLIKMTITSVRAIIDHDPTRKKKCCTSHDNQCQHVLDTRRKERKKMYNLQIVEKCLTSNTFFQNLVPT